MSACPPAGSEREGGREGSCTRVATYAVSRHACSLAPLLTERKNGKPRLRGWHHPWPGLAAALRRHGVTACTWGRVGLVWGGGKRGRWRRWRRWRWIDEGFPVFALLCVAMHCGAGYGSSSWADQVRSGQGKGKGKDKGKGARRTRCRCGRRLDVAVGRLLTSKRVMRRSSRQVSKQAGKQAAQHTTPPRRAHPPRSNWLCDQGRLIARPVPSCPVWSCPVLFCHVLSCYR